MTADRPSTEPGSITTAVMVITVAVIAAAGLAFDGGRKLNALSLARDVADNAARVGAQEIDVDVYRSTGTPTLDSGEATAAANAYLATVGHPGTVAVSGETITVTVTIDVDPLLLPGSMTVRATESADAVEGIDS